MLSESPALFYTLLDPLYFESLSRYKPTASYRDPVTAMLGGSWEVMPAGFWTQCTPRGHEVGAQGWKIHLSSSMRDGRRILDLVVPVFAEHGAPFKFASDERMHSLGLNKNWPRSGGGKFITVYPRDDAQFFVLIERCHALTEGLVGPFILSDRPYKDSRIVYYRYGEHRGEQRITASGDRTAVVRGPDGTRYSDDRQAYYKVPPFVTDPFDATPVEAPPEGGILLNDRYRIEGAIRFSSSGGIYTALDTRTGDTVIIRESRPFFGGQPGIQDGNACLEKEARILQRLGPTGYTPRFIDLFKEWEHSFLVQEKLDAESLWGYAINFTHKTEKRTAQETFEDIRRTIKTIAKGLMEIHAHGVVLRDLTKTNVMFTKDDQVRFIDFELSYETDRDDRWIPGSTAGYASVQQQRNERPSVEEDYFAFGALILDMLTFTVVGFALHPEGTLEGLSHQLADLGLPHVLRDIIVGLTDPNPAARWSLERVCDTVDRASVQQRHRPVFAAEERREGNLAADVALRAELAETLQGVGDFILASPDYERRDRLWPASGDVFRTNPISVQYGAAGTGYFLLESGRGIPERAMDWMLAAARWRAAPSGLYLGLSGYALFLHDAGRPEEAAAAMRASRDEELIYEIPFLYEGAAGWGLANVNFWQRTGEQHYLDAATEVGERLLASVERDDQGAFWSHRGHVTLGMGHGQAGVALFLTYLYAATRDERWATLAAEVLDTELAERQDINGKLLWFPQRNANVGGPKSPHMRFGTAGIGSAILRLHAVTGDERLGAFARQCADSVVTRWTNKIWHDYGIAGYGEYLLDAHAFLGDQRFLDDAFYCAKALLPFRMRRDTGIAFPGSELLRISCDFAQGSAGIGLFLNRLLAPATRRILLPDELLVTMRAERAGDQMAGDATLVAAD